MPALSLPVTRECRGECCELWECWGRSARVRGGWGGSDLIVEALVEVWILLVEVLVVHLGSEGTFGGMGAGDEGGEEGEEGEEEAAEEQGQGQEEEEEEEEEEDSAAAEAKAAELLRRRRGLESMGDKDGADEEALGLERDAW